MLACAERRTDDRCAGSGAVPCPARPYALCGRHARPSTMVWRERLATTLHRNHGTARTLQSAPTHDTNSRHQLMEPDSRHSIHSPNSWSQHMAGLTFPALTPTHSSALSPRLSSQVDRDRVIGVRRVRESSGSDGSACRARQMTRPSAADANRSRSREERPIGTNGGECPSVFTADRNRRGHRGHRDQQCETWGS